MWFKNLIDIRRMAKADKKEKMPIDFDGTEHSTPKAGYILLFLMFIAALFFGWRAIDDLKDVPQKPEFLSYCAASFIDYSWEDYGRNGIPTYPSQAEVPLGPVPAAIQKPYGSSEFPVDIKPACLFSSYEVKSRIPAVFEKREALSLELNNFELDLQKAINSIADSERQYNLALEEKTAEEQKKLYSIPDIQNKLESLRQEKTELEIKIDKARGDLKPIDDDLKVRYREVMKDYRYQWRWYEFKVFLLELLFVLPFFLFVFWGYQRLLFRNSPYAIIFTALLGVASVLLLRVFIVWFWSLFLARIIQTVWQFIQNFALLRSLVFYGGMVLSIVIFGGAVYILQKRIFDPRRVAIRRIRDKQCPSCQTSLDLADIYCPNCGRELKEKCSVCGTIRWKDLAFCPHCKNKIVF